MLKDFDKSQYSVFGERGLPEHYPIPSNIDNLLFYIQRNLNKNTIVYALNIDNDGIINEKYPMKVFWIKYTDGGIRQELNYLQHKAFGYSAHAINNHTYEFRMDSYHRLRFFIAKFEDGTHKIITKINGVDAKLNNIYVFANEFGLFPKVEYIELYGQSPDNGFPCYEKISI
jgi:hypothetical protein